jgi:hypothetical protein
MSPDRSVTHVPGLDPVRNPLPPVTASVRRLPLSTTKSATVLPGDRTRGLALLWGEPPARLSPWGKRERGIQVSLVAAGRFVRSALLSVFLGNRRSPCFHAHSVWSHLLRCQLVSSIFKRVLPSQCRTERLFERARSAVTSQSPEPGDLQLSKILQATFFFATRCAWLFRSGS